MARLLVCGGGGFVGGHLCSLALRRGWEVHVADATVRDALPGATWHGLDVTRGTEVMALVARLRPSAAVDLAAIADVDRAERDRELAWAVNVEGGRNVASASARTGARCVYLSSDAVFAGAAERYLEEDAPGPVNWYGRTKAEGERAVREAHPGAVAVRASLVLGFPVTGGNSFLAGLERTLASGGSVECPAEEIRTPIDVSTLASCVLELCAGDLRGAIHLGSTDSVDRCTLTRRAVARMGYAEARVAARPPGATRPGRAPRHARGVIGVERARRLLATPLLDWQESLRRAFDERPGKER